MWADIFQSVWKAFQIVLLVGIGLCVVIWMIYGIELAFEFKRCTKKNICKIERPGFSLERPECRSRILRMWHLFFASSSCLIVVCGVFCVMVVNGLAVTAIKGSLYVVILCVTGAFSLWVTGRQIGFYSRIPEARLVYMVAHLPLVVVALGGLLVWARYEGAVLRNGLAPVYVSVVMCLQGAASVFGFENGRAELRSVEEVRLRNEAAKDVDVINTL
jgi:hypothetical protein